MKPKWLERSLMAGPYLTLCTTEDEFRAVLKHLKCKDAPPFHGSDSANGTTHLVQNEGGGGLTAIVCVTPIDDLPAMLGLLVHEAVHVWQAHCRDIGEDEPGDESEAYAVQSIAYQLMSEYIARQSA